MKARILSKIQMQGPIKRKDLLVEMQLTYPQLKDRKMRLMIMDLIRGGEPIASSEVGYKMIQNVRELTEAVNYLKSKARSISIRGNTLIGNYDVKYQDAPANLQFKLF